MGTKYHSFERNTIHVQRREDDNTSRNGTDTRERERMKEAKADVRKQ